MPDHTTIVTIVRDPALKDRAEDGLAAVRLLNEGNAGYAHLGEPGVHELTIGAEALGLPREPGAILPQEPLATTLSCSDARAPIEQLFGRHTNDLFVTRVAGNIASSDVLGSLHYAAAHLPTVAANVVIGHTSCGAVTAAVDATLDPEGYLALAGNSALRGIVDAILAPVTMARAALRDAHGPDSEREAGYRGALIAVGIIANAAMTAMTLAEELPQPAFFGVYDLTTRLVGVPGAEGSPHGLQPAPSTSAELRRVLANAATGISLD